MTTRQSNTYKSPRTVQPKGSTSFSHFPSRDVDEPLTRGYLSVVNARVDVLDAKVDGIANELAELKVTVQVALSEQLRWLIGTQFAVIAIVIAVAGIALFVR